VRLGRFYRRLRDQAMETPSERPCLRCLVGIPILGNPSQPSLTRVIDLLELPKYEALGFRFVAIDPSDEADWVAWRRAHPEAT
jgi:hypothetical protein